MQIIVISLKEEFFSKSDALLGVYTSVSDLALLLRLPPVFLFISPADANSGVRLLSFLPPTV